jgi:hypothetical protein
MSIQSSSMYINNNNIYILIKIKKCNYLLKHFKDMELLLLLILNYLFLKLYCFLFVQLVCLKYIFQNSNTIILF